MTKILKKIRIIIGEDRLLGDLLYYVDMRGRHSLKLSIKAKLETMSEWGRHTGRYDQVDLTNPRIIKKVADGQSIEISYKFENHKLEVKKEIVDGSIERNFYEVVIPFERHLFTLILKNWENLPATTPSPDDLILNKSDLSNEVAIIFSFANEQGKGFMDTNFDRNRDGKTVFFDLPRETPSKLVIGFTNNTIDINLLDLFIAIPYDPTKLS